MIEVCFSYFRTAAVQVALFSAVAAALYLMARRVGPRFGATLVLVAFGGALLLTASSPGSWPRWQVPLPRGAAEAANVGGAPAGGTFVTLEPVKGPLGGSLERAGVADAAESPFRTLRDAWRPTQALAVPSPWPWPHLIMAAVAAGIGLALGRLAWGLLCVHRLSVKSRAVDDANVRRCVDPLAARLGVQRSVALKESEGLNTPATIGWRRPTILLPSAWREWSADELRAALAHELAHISAHDFVGWVLARFSLALHFYNPLLHWLAGRLHLEQELAADEAAAAALGNRPDYLRSLASLALATPPQAVPGLLRTFVPTRSLLLKRVESLRDSLPRRRTPGRAAALRLSSALGLCSAIVIVAGIRTGTLAAGQDTIVMQPGAGHYEAAHALHPVDGEVASFYELPAAKDAATLVSFIDKVRNVPDKYRQIGAMNGRQIDLHYQRATGGMARALEELAKLETTEDEQRKALTAAINFLEVAQGFLPNGHDDMLIAGIHRLVGVVPEDVQPKAAALALDFEILGFADKSPEERAALADKLAANLGDRSLGAVEFDRLTRFCEAAETAGDAQLARSLVERLRPTITRLGDMSRAEVLFGLDQRLSLPGDTLEVDGTIRDKGVPDRVGDELDLKSLEDNVVVVFFFDETTVGQIEILSTIQDRYRNRDVKVVGYYTGYSGHVDQPIFENRYSFPLLITHEISKEALRRPTCLRYGITRAPHVMIIGRDGKVVNANVPIESLEGEVKSLLK